MIAPDIDRPLRGDRPPRWAEWLLQATLTPRDRETIPGDLLEEYREVILPTRGRVRANLWYLRQVLSLVHGVTIGLVIGFVFGVWNLVVTILVPLLDDGPLALAAFYGPMFFLWGAAGWMAARRTGHLSAAVKTGAIVASVTFIVFDATVILRMNVFLEVIKYRDDWRNMVANFPASGFDSFRTYVNYVYITASPFKIVAATVIGTVCGSIGGLTASLGPQRGRRIQA
jgi:hypothetical protein